MHLSLMPGRFFQLNRMDPFSFLKLFTQSDGTLPSFFVFISFLGPLLGISLGFDAVNSEQNRGTLSRILAQPVPRDYLLNAKFVAGVLVVALMFFSLSFLVIGAGLFVLGHPPTAEEFMRIIVYTFLAWYMLLFGSTCLCFFRSDFDSRPPRH